jgi:hypothetical protein
MFLYQNGLFGGKKNRKKMKKKEEEDGEKNKKNKKKLRGGGGGGAALGRRDPNAPAQRQGGRKTKRSGTSSAAAAAVGVHKNGKQRAPPPPDQFAILDHIVAGFRGREALLLHLVKSRCSLERGGGRGLGSPSSGVSSSPRSSPLSPAQQVAEAMGEDGASSASSTSAATTMTATAAHTADATTQTCFDDLQREKAQRRRLEKRVTELELERETLMCKTLELGVAAESRRKDVVTLRDESLRNHQMFAKLSNILDGLLADEGNYASSAMSLSNHGGVGRRKKEEAEADLPNKNGTIVVQQEEVAVAVVEEEEDDDDEEEEEEEKEKPKQQEQAPRAPLPTQDGHSPRKSISGQMVRRKSTPIAIPITDSASRYPFGDFNFEAKRGNSALRKLLSHSARERRPNTGKLHAASSFQVGHHHDHAGTAGTSSSLASASEHTETIELTSSSLAPESFMSIRDHDFALGTSLNPLACDTLVTPHGFSGFMSMAATRLKSAERKRRGPLSKNAAVMASATMNMSMTTTPPRQRQRFAGGAAAARDANVTPLGRERSAFRAAMASAERRSTRAALDICEEKLLESTSALAKMTKRADGMESQAHALRSLMATRAVAIANARSALQERATQASTALQSVRSLKLGDIQRTTTRRGRSSYYKRLGF